MTVVTEAVDPQKHLSDEQIAELKKTLKKALLDPANDQPPPGMLESPVQGAAFDLNAYERLLADGKTGKYPWDQVDNALAITSIRLLRELNILAANNKAIADLMVKIGPMLTPGKIITEAARTEATLQPKSMQYLSEEQIGRLEAALAPIEAPQSMLQKAAEPFKSSARALLEAYVQFLEHGETKYSRIVVDQNLERISAKLLKELKELTKTRDPAILSLVAELEPVLEIHGKSEVAR